MIGYMANNVLPLRAGAVSSEIASAQVKSAVLLAGLFAEGETSFTEPARSRDHTERLLTLEMDKQRLLTLYTDSDRRVQDKLLEIGGVMHGVVLKWNEKK